MLAPPRKRPRSPSPPPDEISSPLDILLKRRRQYSYANTAEAQDYISYDPNYNSAQFDQPGPSISEGSWSRFVEKRRTRQWEKLNNPSSSQASTHQNLSQPTISHDGSSPIRPQWHRQPESSRQPMSSSPIRNEAPTSSPFRINESQSSTRVGDGMDEEEMRREWGEEYYSQNALLHRLHLARTTHYDEHRPQLEVDHIISDCPLGPVLLSPSIYNQPCHNQTPCQTPYRNSYFLPSSPFAQNPASLMGTPNYLPHHNNSFPASSPFPFHDGPSYSQNLCQTPNKQNDAMEVLTSPERPTNEAEADVRLRYEETNRLLAELAVVRRQRWGDDMAH